MTKEDTMFKRFCERFLPVYIRFWSSFYWLAVESVPVWYPSPSILERNKRTHWQALRITIMHDKYRSEIIFVL